MNGETLYESVLPRYTLSSAHELNKPFEKLEGTIFKVSAPSSMLIFLREVHPSNADSPISVTFFPIVISVRVD